MASDGKSRERVTDDCDGCENREMCPVPNGSCCLLVASHLSELTSAKPLSEKQ